MNTMPKYHGKLYFLLVLLCCFSLQAYCKPSEILVVYDSRTGHTRLMAEAVANGARKVSDVHVKIISVHKVTLDDAKLAQAIIIGSPVHNANVTPEIQSFINSWPHDGMRDKLGAAFVSAGGISAGQEITMLNVLHSMLIFRMIIVGGNTWQTPFGAVAVDNEAPFQNKQLEIAPQFLKQATDLGERVALTLKKFKA